METAVYTAAYFAIVIFALVALGPLDKRLTIRFALLFALYLVLDDFLTGLPYSVPAFDLNPAHWNWAGKVYSILFSTTVIYGLRMSPQAVALTLPQRNVKAGAMSLVLLVPMGVVLALIYNPALPDAETVAFQLLMPALAEELAFRGIAPALLLGLVRGENPAAGIPWAVVFIAAVPFGVVHGLAYAGGQFSFDLPSALWTFSGGVIYGWLRFSTGSLLFPLLAHGLANVAFHLTPLIRA